MKNQIVVGPTGEIVTLSEDAPGWHHDLPNMRESELSGSERFLLRRSGCRTCYVPPGGYDGQMEELVRVTIGCVR